MKKQIAKKTIILYVLIALKKGSTRERPVSQTSIAKVLNMIGVECDRKTVGRNIGYLIDFGCPIIKLNGKYYYKNEDDTMFNF